MGQNENAVWDRFRPRLGLIEARHRREEDPEAPSLPNAVVVGARRLMGILVERRESPPTLMTGTCDATITFEWQDKAGTQTFRSLDVLSENAAEEFIMIEDGPPILRTMTF